MPRKRFFAMLLVLMLLSAAQALTRDELRARWERISSMRVQDRLYAQAPSTQEMYPGTLKEAALQNALELLNLLRELAALPPLSLSPLYTLRAQCGALLLSSNNVLTHEPVRPEHMDSALYESAYLGASRGNIAKLEGTQSDPLLTGILRFAGDEGANNLQALGHRRYLLSPRMRETGLGLAQAADGSYYVCMYIEDESEAEPLPAYVAWPAPGVFPAELMHSDTPWSISLSPECYAADSAELHVTLTEEISGTVFHFYPNSGAGDGYSSVSKEPYGAGTCIIFRPNLDASALSAYEQNQRWRVELTGLVQPDGDEQQLQYVLYFVSLYPQSTAGIELSCTEMSLAVGEVSTLRARVIPSYADELSFTYASSDPTIASISELGEVHAHRSGTCTITAVTPGGHSDECRIVVD